MSSLQVMSTSLLWERLGAIDFPAVSKIQTLKYRTVSGYSKIFSVLMPVRFGVHMACCRLWGTTPRTWDHSPCIGANPLAGYEQFRGKEDSESALFVWTCHVINIKDSDILID